MFTITYNLNGCTITNNQSEIEEGENYIASLSVSEGSIINISSVSIIMGGVDITGIAYDNGNINILSVSGNITINASSIEMLNAPEINASDKILTMIDTDERATSYDIYIDGEFVATVARGPRSGATTNLKNTKWYIGDKFDFIDITALGEDGTVGYICFNLTGQLYEVGSKTPYFTTTPDRSYVHFARALYLDDVEQYGTWTTFFTKNEFMPYPLLDKYGVHRVPEDEIGCETIIETGSTYGGHPFIVCITGGAATSNTALINWFNRNATRIYDTTFFDLSTTGLTAGEYNITVVAKADGYASSVPSAGSSHNLPFASTPTVSVHPIGLSYARGATPNPLTVAASVNDYGTLTYQWQASTDGGITYSNIAGATSSSYTPSTAVIGETIYRCVITNTLNGSTASINSNGATISILDTKLAAPSYTISNSIMTITDNSNGASSFNIYLNGVYKTFVNKNSTGATTFDLRKLGLDRTTYTIGVSAVPSAGSGLEMSNIAEQSYTYTNPGYTITIGYVFDWLDNIDITFYFTNGTTSTYSISQLYNSYRGESFTNVYKVAGSYGETSWYCLFITSDSNYIYLTPEGGQTNAVLNIEWNCTMHWEEPQSCITEDSMVLMADGTYKPLGEIKTGDYILSYNWETMQLEPNKVIYASSEEENWDTGWFAKRYYKWTFSDGTVIKNCFSHRFYNREAEAFIYLEYWRIGDHTYKEDGTTPYLVSVEEVWEEVRYARITGENGTNYFANGLLTGDRHCPSNLNLPLE